MPNIHTIFGWSKKHARLHSAVGSVVAPPRTHATRATLKTRVVAAWRQVAKNPMHTTISNLQSAAPRRPNEWSVLLRRRDTSAIELKSALA